MASEFVLLLEKSGAEAESQAKRLGRLAGEDSHGAVLIVRPSGYFWGVVALWDAGNESACRWVGLCWNIVKGESRECQKWCENEPLSDFGMSLDELKRKRLEKTKEKTVATVKKSYGVARAGARKNMKGKK